MTALDLAAIEQRANAATEGPWTVGIECDGVHADKPTVVRLDHGPRIVTVDQTRPHVAADGAAEANVAFIAAARTDVPQLVARVRELEAALAENERAVLIRAGEKIRDRADAYAPPSGDPTLRRVRHHLLEAARLVEPDLTEDELRDGITRLLGGTTGRPAGSDVTA